MLRTLPDAHRVGARPDPPLPATAGANDVVEMQSQRPRPFAAGRASKPRPRAAARKPPQMDADALLDVAELDEELRRVGRDDAQRPQSRDGKARQVFAVSGYHVKLDNSDAVDGATRAPIRVIGCGQASAKKAAAAFCFSRRSRACGGRSLTAGTMSFRGSSSFLALFHWSEDDEDDEDDRSPLLDKKREQKRRNFSGFPRVRQKARWRTGVQSAVVMCELDLHVSR
jgi:hypothetical protein